MLAKAWPGLGFNEHMEGDGAVVFRHACKLGEGIGSNRLRPPACAGREREERGLGNTKTSDAVSHGTFLDDNAPDWIGHFLYFFVQFLVS